MNDKRNEFAKIRNGLLKNTSSGMFICARCGAFSKSTHLHHINELWEGGENDVHNLIPLCGDCHLEWDTCYDTGMSFGEFLVSLRARTWNICLKLGMFKVPYNASLCIGKTLETVYKLQFTGCAIRYKATYTESTGWNDYWKELKAQNEVFNMYPYSDHDKMIDLYGAMYKTTGQQEYARSK